MKLTNTQLQFFVKKIKLSPESMPKFREQIANLKEKLQKKIKEEQKNDLRVTKYLIAGSWKKHTILRPTGEHPIDIDLVLFVEGDDNIKNDIGKLHNFIVKYLEQIYPQKDISKDVDAKGNTKSVTIKFKGTGLEVDIVPVVPLVEPKEYVWQPQRGGGGTYITSVSKQLEFTSQIKRNNPSYTSIVRMLKWWRNEKELNPTDNEPGLSSFAIELIVAYLDVNQGVEENIEEAVIRFFQFISTPNFPIIKFKNAIKSVPNYLTPIYIADNTNNENNVAKKIDNNKWDEVFEEAENAFEILNFAQEIRNEGDTIAEWKSVFGSSFNIK